jgi:hypothetical protein
LDGEQENILRGKTDFVTGISVLLKRKSRHTEPAAYRVLLLQYTTHMHYRFFLFISLLATLASCQPVNRGKNAPAVAVEKPQPATSGSQTPDTPQQPEADR